MQGRGSLSVIITVTATGTRISDNPPDSERRSAGRWHAAAPGYIAAGAAPA
jgi:hypothetical protein